MLLSLRPYETSSQVHLSDLGAMMRAIHAGVAMECRDSLGVDVIDADQRLPRCRVGCCGAVEGPTCSANWVAGQTPARSRHGTRRACSKIGGTSMLRVIVSIAIACGAA